MKSIKKLTGWQVIVFFILLRCCISSTSDMAAYARTEVHEPEFAGWLTYWDFERGVSTVVYQPGAWNDIFIFAAFLDKAGNIVLEKGLQDKKPSITRIASSGIKTWLTIVNDVRDLSGKITLKDPVITHKLLNDAELMSRHINAIISLARQIGVIGIDIDYENIWYKDRDAFTEFVKHLAGETHKNSLQLSVTVQPKKGFTRAQGSGSVNWLEICPFVDRFQVMLYNLHNSRTEPGALATLPWIKDIMAFAVTQCGREKLVPALKLSGMKWQPTKAHALTFLDAVQLVEENELVVNRQSPKTGSAPFFTYQSAQGSNTVYFEDITSLARKVDFLHFLGFSRIIFWSLGRHDQRLSKYLVAQKNVHPIKNKVQK